MAKTTIEIPDHKMAELEAYKDRLGELLLLGLSQIKIQEALLLYKRGLVSMSRKWCTRLGQLESNHAGMRPRFRKNWRDCLL